MNFTRASLKPYQLRAVEFIRAHTHCALWVDMGLGKTVSTLTAFLDLMEGFEAQRLLVIAPLRVARKVWLDEVDKWAHTRHLTVAKVIGTPAERLRALATPADIHTINREQVMWLEDQFIADKKQIRVWPWDMVAIDESQSFKSAASQRFKSMRRLRRLAKRIVELTGTPAPNGYADLWAQYYLLDRGQRLGATVGAFRERWFDCQLLDGYAKWTPRKTSIEEIQLAVADITLSLRAEDYLDMEPVRHNTIRVQLPQLIQSKYKRLARQYVLEAIDGRVITAANAGVVGGKLLQLANGAVYVSDHDWTDFHEEKLDALEEALDGIAGKAIICYAFRHDLARIRKRLDAYCGKDRKWARLVSEDAEDRWNRGELDYLVLHPQSAGHGLNLQGAGATNLIWFGLTNNLELYQQANARLTGGLRRGDKSIVIHHIIAEETVDEELIGLLERKDTVQSDLTRAVTEYAKEVIPCLSSRGTS